MNVFDIGANIGYYTLIQRQLIGFNGKITAIEPVPDNIEILKKNRLLLDKLVDILLNQETIDKQVFKLTTSKLLKVWFNCFKLKKI